MFAQINRFLNVARARRATQALDPRRAPRSANGRADANAAVARQAGVVLHVAAAVLGGGSVRGLRLEDARRMDTFLVAQRAARPDLGHAIDRHRQHLAPALIQRTPAQLLAEAKARHGDTWAATCRRQVAGAPDEIENLGLRAAAARLERSPYLRNILLAQLHQTHDHALAVLDRAEGHAQSRQERVAVAADRLRLGTAMMDAMQVAYRAPSATRRV